MDVVIIFDRLKAALQIRTDHEMADLLGLSRQDLSHRKRKTSFLPMIISLALDRNIDTHWLLTGQAWSSEAAAPAPASSVFRNDYGNIVAILQEKTDLLGQLIQEKQHSMDNERRYFQLRHEQDLRDKEYLLAKIRELETQLLATGRRPMPQPCDVAKEPAQTLDELNRGQHDAQEPEGEYAKKQ